LAREAVDIPLLMKYPDPELARLRAAISTHLGISESSIAVANGSAALLDAAIRGVGPKRCILPTPAFSEYRRALDSAHCVALEFPLEPQRNFLLDEPAFSAAIAKECPEMCIITNPHNPSGSLTARHAVEEIARSALSVGSVVLLDEAFIDYVPGETFTRTAGQSENLVVLRSLTKFYGMPALRVGFAVAAPDIASAMRAQLPSWPVTTLAANAAVEALQDSDYAARTRESNAREREHLSAALTDAGLRVFPSSANFLLVELPEGAPSAGNVRERMITKCGIIVRDCSTYKGMESGQFIRVAVRDRLDNERLVGALHLVLAR
jgi:threonine-phosphate decarboxylase